MTNKEAIEKMWSIYSDWCDHCETQYTDRCLTCLSAEAIHMAIDALAAAAAAGRDEWNLCSKIMPKESEWIGTKEFGTTISEEVYVTFETPDNQRFTRHLSFQNGKLAPYKQREIQAFHEGAVPIAWKPLPDPYTGGAAE